MVGEITIRKPADMHHHFRKGPLLDLIARHVAPRFAMAIVMPNTDPPITTHQAMVSYRRAVLNATRSGFKPLMTLYLTDTLDPKTVSRCMSSGYCRGVKYYPRGLTTNSENGVANPRDLWTPGTRPYEVLQVLAAEGGVLLLHAADGFDTNGEELDPYDQERHFFQKTLPQIRVAHPRLKISVEHLSTKEGVAYMEAYGGSLFGCSLTAHHLLLDRRDVFRKGFQPHRSWWPVIQPQEHKEALWALVRKKPAFVWLGSDSAPHPRTKKEAPCCLGGVLMAHAGIELYAEAFEDIGVLDYLEQFASVNGPTFYGVAPSTDSITLIHEEWTVKKSFQAFVPQATDPNGIIDIVPFRLGESVRWRLAA